MRTLAIGWRSKRGALPVVGLLRELVDTIADLRARTRELHHRPLSG